MYMEKTSWMDHPTLQKMEPVKKEILLDLIKESEGKTLNQSLPILMKAQGRLKASGSAFTQEETALIMSILTKDLSAADLAKVEMMKNMMKK